jgi:hypothetical protein
MLDRLRKLLGSNDLPPRYFAIKDGQRAGGLVTNDGALRSLLTNTGHNLYVHLNPSVARQFSPKANASDVTHFTNLLVDIDPLSADAEPRKALDAATTALETLLPGSTEASSVVYSGRGFQIWVHFAGQDLRGNQELRHSVHRATSALLGMVDCGTFGCRVDTSCSDLSRVARLPGSVNQKTGQLASYLREDYTRLLDIGSLLVFDSGPPVRTDAPKLPPGSPVGFVLPHLTLKAATFLTEGVDSPGRHASAYAAAASLREAGIELETAAEWVVRGGKRCDPPLPPSECIAATRCAYNGWSK